MRAINFEGVTHFFGKPENWDTERDGVCLTLPVQVVSAFGDSLELVSMWKPTAEELKQLAAGACVRLAVFGGQPPVMLSVETVSELPPQSAERN